VSPDLRFLVVEDHDFQRSALLQILATLGARRVESAADGRAAMAAMAACNAGSPGPDIIITDLDMPGMDGIEFLRHIGQAAWPVSVIVASAADDAVLDSVRRMAHAYGVMVLGVLPKPVTLGALAALVGRHGATRAGPPGAQPPRQVHTLAEIAQGLRANQFEPFFQPKLVLATGRLQGLEALARWRRPGVGIVSPAAFIPALEGHALMETLTWEMLSRSAAASAGWRKQGLDTCVSVNVSAASLTNVQFAGRLAVLVRSHGLEPRHLMLELTESAAVQSDSGAAMENLSRLRLQGFGLACDDFGTGYASMQQLARVAFSELKIDQGFVRQSDIAGDGTAAGVILRATLEMAKRLKLVSVGEGVETQQEWDLLRQLGCELAQGYFIAPPMEAAAVLDWARANGDLPP
jgi:EAL domain-containing protein (putative c-di-GMP-specific phosphodiesterase class I)/FixJ family two-component response regulator